MTDIVIRNCRYLLIVTVLFYLSLTSTHAENHSLMVNISGSISESACTVNANKPVTVEFGSVQVSKLGLSKVDVPVTISCDTVPSGTLSMEIKGTSSTFDSQALATNLTGLGILLSTKGTTQYGSLDLNTFYDVTSTFGLTSKTGTFNLSATLISDSTTILGGGEFNASATLLLQMS